MALEAINHAGHLPKTNLVVVLNDNEMSISPNVGAIPRYLNKMRLSPPMQFLTDNIEEQFKQLPFSEAVTPELSRVKEGMKRLAMPKVGAVFEELGFTYMGPIDGHNLTELISAFKEAHSHGGPVLVHVATVKGKGYEIAEKDQVGYHAQSPFDLETGQKVQNNKPKPPGYSKVFAETLITLAEKDPTIAGITAAMATGTRLDLLQAKLPKQYIDVGIAEQHAVTLAAGLACEGMKPVPVIYSTFLQRGFDQIVHDICIQKLPVFLALDRAGIVGVDGAYAEYVEGYGTSFDGGAGLAASCKNVVMTRTFSKLYGLGGLRVGWGYSCQEIIDVLNRVRGPFNLSLPALAAAEAAVGDTAFVSHCLAENARLRKSLREDILKMGLACDKSDANFLLVRFRGAAEANAAEAALKAAGIIVRQVAGYGFPEGLRITVGDEDGCRRVTEAVGAVRGVRV